MPQQVETYLQTLKVPQSVKADAWDAVYASKDDADAEARLKRLPLTNPQRAQLWDLRAPSPEPQPAAPRTWGDTARDVGRGAAAGATSTVFRGGDLLRRGWNATVPGERFDVERVIERPAVQAAMTPPDSMAGRIGYGVEQLAEFAVPMTKVATATRAAPLVARMTAEGGTAAALSAAQGGDALLGAALGVAGPVLSRVIQTAPMQRVGTALREGAEKRMAQALGATKERFKAMAEKLAPQMLAKGVPGSLGANRKQLLEQARAQASAYGQAIDTALTGAADEPIQTGLILSALEDAKAAFRVSTRMPAQDAVKRGLAARAMDLGDGVVEVRTVIDARPIEQLQKLQQTIAELGDEATVGQIVAIRRVWDDVVARTGGFAHRSGGAFGVPLAEQTEAWAKREATTAIRKVLAEAQPDLAALNKEYAFWANLRQVLTATEKRTQAQSGGLSRTILGGAGLTAGALTGDRPSDRVQNAIIGGIAGRQLLSAVTSPRWRFASAALRNKLADALASGRTGEIIHATTRLSSAIAGGGSLRSPTYQVHERGPEAQVQQRQGQR